MKQPIHVGTTLAELFEFKHLQTNLSDYYEVRRRDSPTLIGVLLFGKFKACSGKPLKPAELIDIAKFIEEIW